MELKSDQSESSTGAPSGNQRLVLVVDDDAALGGFITHALEAEGYRCLRTSDGHSALAAVAETKPDLILLDVHMPGIDGWSVISALRARAGPHQPIVVMTGQYEGQERALASGAQGYLAKPFDLDDLIACVDLHSGLRMENNLSEQLHSAGDCSK